jgi:upstream activation factor subunit UAF30
MQEMKLSEELSAVVGIKRAPRHEVVKRMWRYIKENDLQWPKNKQWIKSDEKLFTLIGQKKFKGFGMTKYLKDHMS